MGFSIQAHFRTVNLRIAELERAVGTFSAKGNGGGRSDAADVEPPLASLFQEKWGRAAAERSVSTRRSARSELTECLQQQLRQETRTESLTTHPIQDAQSGRMRSSPSRYFCRRLFLQGTHQGPMWWPGGFVFDPARQKVCVPSPPVSAQNHGDINPWGVDLNLRRSHVG